MQTGYCAWTTINHTADGGMTRTTSLKAELKQDGHKGAVVESPGPSSLQVIATASWSGWTEQESHHGLTSSHDETLLRFFSGSLTIGMC